MTMTIFDKIRTFTNQTYKSVGEVAQFFACSEKTIYRLLESGTLAAVRFGDRGAFKILSESAAYVLVEQLWSDSYDRGCELKGVDLGELEAWAKRFGIFTQ